MVRSHAHAHHDRKLVIVFPHQRDDLIHDVMEILFLTPGAPAVVSEFVGPCFQIHRIHYEQLDAAIIDIFTDLVGHAEILHLAAHAVLGREGEKRNSPVTVDHHMHLFAERCALMGQ